METHSSSNGWNSRISKELDDGNLGYQTAITAKRPVCRLLLHWISYD
jgi:hypothetical protein